MYLSPDLETEFYPVTVAVVVHELAHALSRQIVDEESERLADHLIRQWGWYRHLFTDVRLQERLKLRLRGDKKRVQLYGGPATRASRDLPQNLGTSLTSGHSCS